MTNKCPSEWKILQLLLSDELRRQPQNQDGNEKTSCMKDNLSKKTTLNIFNFEKTPTKFQLPSFHRNKKNYDRVGRVGVSKNVF